MKISIIHPSRGRAGQAFNTYRNWHNKISGTHDVEYILSIDSTDNEQYAYFDLFGDTNVNAVVKDNHSAIEAINNAAKYATGDLFIVVSDDFDCPDNWDIYLLDALAGKSDFVVKTDDGCQPWIITLPIMDRVYYNRFGYIYPPHIKHMFADTWMTHVADLLDKKITLPIKFPHNHYTTGINAKDAINEKNDSTWAQGEEEYLKGVRNNFGLTEFTGKLQCGKDHYNWLRAHGINIQQ